MRAGARVGRLVPDGPGRPCRGCMSRVHVAGRGAAGCLGWWGDPPRPHDREAPEQAARAQ